MRVLEWEDFISPRSISLAPGTDKQSQAASSDLAKLPVLTDSSGLANPSALAVSIGVFDGVHRGHQRLIEKIVRHGQGSIPAVVTFRQSPRQILHPDSWHGDIYSLKQKLKVLESLGVEEVILIDFSGNFSRISGREFVDFLKSQRRIDFLTVGANFRCGYHLDTDAAALKDMNLGDGIITEVADQVLEGGHPVSSSRIRRAILAGNLVEAALLLGRPFRIELEGIPAVNAGTGVLYDTAAAGRVVPPSGSYPARVFQMGEDSADSENFNEGIKEISIDDGKILIPSPLGGLAVEF